MTWPNKIEISSELFYNTLTDDGVANRYVPCKSIEEFISFSQNRISCALTLVPPASSSYQSHLIWHKWLHKSHWEGEPMVRFWHRGDADRIIKVAAGAFGSKVTKFTFPGATVPEEIRTDSRYAHSGFEWRTGIDIAKLYLKDGWQYDSSGTENPKNLRKDIDDLGESMREILKEIKVIQYSVKDQTWHAQGFKDLREDTDLSQVEHLLSRNEKVKAIKQYRRIVGVGLKESKQAVDYFIAHGNFHWMQPLNLLFSLKTKDLAEMLYAFPEMFSFKDKTP